MRISDWSSDVCSSDLVERRPRTKMTGEYHSVLGGRAVSDWGLHAETRIMNKHRQLGKAPALSCNPGFTFPNIPRRLISMIHRCPANESELHLARRVTNRNDRSWHDPDRKSTRLNSSH